MMYDLLNVRTSKNSKLYKKKHVSKTYHSEVKIEELDMRANEYFWNGPWSIESPNRNQTYIRR